MMRGDDARRRIDPIERRVAHVERLENLRAAKLSERTPRDALDDRAQQDDVAAGVLVVRVDRPFGIVLEQAREDFITFELAFPTDARTLGEARSVRRQSPQ